MQSNGRWSHRLSVIAMVLSAVPARAGAQDTVPAATADLDALLDARISTAAKYAQTVAQAPSAVSIITAEDIERYGYRTLDQALASVTGFYTTHDRSYTGVASRGLSRPNDYNSRILLLIDGNTVNDGVSGSAPLGTEFGLPLQAIERIEVVRGPGSVLYGSGAVFAVVNVITKSAAVLNGAELAVGAGSYGRRGGSLLFGRRLGDDIEVTLGGLWDGADGQDHYYPEFDTPETNNGVAHNLDWERRWAVLGSVARGDLTLRGRYSSRTKAVPTAPYGAAFNVAGSENTDVHGYVELAYRRELSAAQQLLVRTYLNVARLDGQLGRPIGGVVPYTSRTTRIGTEAMLQWDLGSANRVTAGAEARYLPRADFWFPAVFLDLEDRRTEWSVYLQDEYQLSRALTLLGGLRYDRRDAIASLTPRAAVIYTPFRGTVFKLLYGEALRAPTVGQAKTQFDDGPPPDLDAEVAETTELLWQQRLARDVLGTLSVYRYHAHGLIEAVTNASGRPLRYANTGHADATGAEVRIEARLDHRLAVAAGYAYQDAKDEATGLRLTNSPVHQLHGRMSVEATSWLRPAAELRFESPRRALGGVSTSSYLLADAHLLITPAHDRLRLSLRVNNVFDADYAVPGGPLHAQRVLPQDGRNVSVELGHRF